VLERLVDLIVVELAADVEPDAREAQVTVRQLVVFQAKDALAQAAPGGYGRLATSAFTELWDVVHLAPLR
jgi:hypothetical protein